MLSFCHINRKGDASLNFLPYHQQVSVLIVYLSGHWSKDMGWVESLHMFGLDMLPIYKIVHVNFQFIVKELSAW